MSKEKDVEWEDGFYWVKTDKEDEFWDIAQFQNETKLWYTMEGIISKEKMKDIYKIIIRNPNPDEKDKTIEKLKEMLVKARWNTHLSKCVGPFTSEELKEMKDHIRAQIEKDLEGKSMGERIRTYGKCGTCGTPKPTKKELEAMLDEITPEMEKATEEAYAKWEKKVVGEGGEVFNCPECGTRQVKDPKQ